ncbi:hypothetical protein FLSA109164_01505 [Flavobacterium saliperosum]|uniref:Uncharacterized protein n=1 Tax=Flavobacterium saliperosum TaxID=329186 RepID=A0A1G4VSB3_9FLAO|nr:hypothetical protein SAMN02927925_01719 [Flavobacterium saliperosum]
MLIVIVTILQFSLYFILDRYKYYRIKWVVFILIVFCNLVFFPDIFIQKFREEEGGTIRCGLPVMAIHLAFWIFGNGASVFTHIVYRFIKIKNRE